MNPSTDSESLRLLAESVRATMTGASGARLDAALADLGWLDMLAEMPETAVPLVFRLLGESGARAPVLNDVMLRASGGMPGGTLPLPFTGGTWVVWERADLSSSAIDEELPIRTVPQGEPVPRERWRRGGWRRVGGWSGPVGRCCRWRVNTLWTASNSGDASALSKRSGIGWPRHSSRSRGPRRPCTPPPKNRTVWRACWPRPPPARRR